jgi:hypothetical protein
MSSRKWCNKFDADILMAMAAAVHPYVIMLLALSAHQLSVTMDSGNFGHKHTVSKLPVNNINHYVVSITRCFHLQLVGMTVQYRHQIAPY